MINKDNYKGFDKNLTKEDLDEEELIYYNKLMEGINEASEEEKDDISHLINVCIDIDESLDTHCIRCKKEFDDNDIGLDKDNKRIYCDSCLKKMWSP